MTGVLHSLINILNKRTPCSGREESEEGNGAEGLFQSRHFLFIFSRTGDLVP